MYAPWASANPDRITTSDPTGDIITAGAKTNRPSFSRCRPTPADCTGTGGAATLGGGAAPHEGPGAAPHEGSGTAPHEGPLGKGGVSEGGHGGTGGGAVKAGVGTQGTAWGGTSSV